ncbi:MAG TPA: thymidine phosphorylase family protein [Nevskiaceae bacterium]|nr:thymidine phosphorylase family protein [Nevskiaceae bacterium]
MNELLRHDQLSARRLGIDTYREPVVYMHVDCAVCRAEGFRAMSRVQLSTHQRSVIATLNVVHDGILGREEAGLSEAAWRALGCHDGEIVRVSHTEMVESFSAVRSKIYGNAFTQPELEAIIRDITAGRYASIETAAFVTACAGNRMSLDETLALTRAMVKAGTRLAWPERPVLDKHSVGGLPGNRTTPIVVAIVAANGLTIPKTSSRAITSPAGTADTMEVLTPVDLTLEHMRRVVEREGGCLVWGGAMALSPADDILIQVERPLDFDSDAQLAASILSKKVAAGSTHLLIDMPVGPSAKIRSAAAAQSLSQRIVQTGQALGLHVDVAQTDGSQPIGRGIGPALEASDLLAVLRNERDASRDLRERAATLAGRLLELGGRTPSGSGARRAHETLDSGAAWEKFQAICAAQGGLSEPPIAPYRREVVAVAPGAVTSFDNRCLSRLAKLAGAPAAACAGVRLHVRIRDRIVRGQPLYTVHAQTAGELDYALAYASAHPQIAQLGESP